MKLSFGASAAAPQQLRQPKTAKFPELKAADVAAFYRAARIGGDYFDFIVVGRKLVFILMDVAGKRDAALHVAAAVQDSVQTRAPKLFASGDDQPAVTSLVLELNKQVIEVAHGVCCAPAFVGCYDQDIHTVTYVNAGHTAGILRDEQGMADLPPNGLPLGLFSHATHDAQFCALSPGASIVLASKGLVEIRGNGFEFGMNRLREVVRESKETTAISLCREIIDAVEKFEAGPKSASSKIAAAVPGLRPPEPNDVTTVALLRNLN